jgi:hypothetical protein
LIIVVFLAFDDDLSVRQRCESLVVKASPTFLARKMN